MASVVQTVKRQKYMYLLLLPGILYFFIFKYLPMWGVLIAFKDYQPMLGFFKSQWVGWEHFNYLVHSPDFVKLIRNTLLLSLYNIIFFFPAPIIFALLLNELNNSFYKRFVQTLVYIPHFISMVVVVGITYVLLNTNEGPINNVVELVTGEKIPFLSSLAWFRPLIIIQTIWKETGWGTIIYLAALAGIDPQLYEAARVDGANRFRQLIHITLPHLKSTTIILLILRMGKVLDNGFEQIYLMTNSLNREVAEVFNTFVYTIGITQGAFSYSTAVGLLKSVIGVILVVGTNQLAKRFGEEGIY